MNFIEIISTIIINAGVANGFLIPLLFRRSRNRNAHFLLSLLLANLSLIVFRFHYLMYDLYNYLGNHFFLTGPFLLLLGPFLYFYLRGIVIPDTSITKKDFKHFIIFVAYWILILPILILGKDGEYAGFLQSVMGSPWLFLVIQFAYYLVQTNRLLKMHRINITEKFSNVEGMDASWLKIIFWIFAAILFYVTIAQPFLIHGIDFDTFKVTSAIFYSLILFFIAYKGINQRVPQEPNVPAEVGQAIPDRETMRHDKEKLLSHIEENKPFLNPELTLVELARQVGMSRNQLSQLINLGVGDNFYNFVNKFRVEEVKRLIKQDAKKQYKILSLANDAGFNSKSSFNNIFKKVTGLTPSEYRDGLN